MCCAPVRDVDSIVIPQALNHLPGQAPDVAGVFQYRSQTVSVHKLHTKFGLPELEDQTKGRIIMAYTVHGLTGFWADEIEEITSGYEAHWSAPPGFVDGNIFDKTLMWREKLLLHTDFDRIFAMRDAAPLTNWIVEHGEELNSEKKPDKQESHDESAVSDEASNVVDLPVELSQEDALSVASSLTDESKAEIDIAQEAPPAAEAEINVADETGEADDEIKVVAEEAFVDVSDLDVSKDSEIVLDQASEVDDVESAEENYQLQGEEAETDEVDDSLYYQALDALGADTDVASSETHEPDVELTEDKQAHIEQLESGEISGLLNRDVENTPHEDLNENFVEETEALIEVKSEPIEIEPVVDEYQIEKIEPIIPEESINPAESREGSGEDLYKDKSSSYKMISGVSALIVVAAISGYIIFGGDEGVEQAAVPGVAEAEISAPAVTQIAEIITPDDVTDSTIASANVGLDVTEQSSLPDSASSSSLQTLEEVVEAEFNKSIQSNNGALGSTKKKGNASIIEDKPQDMVPIKTTISESPLKPLEPQLPVWGVHVVSKGDTLWHLATRYLNNPFRYVELANWSDIKNPDRIYPGENVKYKEEK